MTQPSVALVSLPWTALGEPSLGLAVLRSVLDKAHIPCRVRHSNLFMLRHLKATTYLAIANTFALNDFVFSGVLDTALTGRQIRHLRTRVQEMLSIGLIDESANGGVDGVMQQVIDLRQQTVPAFLEAEAQEILRTGPTMVGLTCMFDQTIAAVALAKRIKQLRRGLLVALGGYAVRAPTGEAILSSFPWIDAICTGEGEHVIAELAWASVRGNLATVPGIMRRDGPLVVQNTPAAPVPMDSSPVPNFDDYFADLARLESEDKVRVEVDTLPYETARGCWWGERKHCTFCGIHDDDMKYRSRKSDTVVDSLTQLRDRYGISTFRFSDYILPNTYFKTLLPDLAERGAPFRLACEMKANSSVPKFALLAAAGFTEVQPGIESFSTDVLRKIDKGVTAAANVLTLVLGRRFQIHIHYNILYGFPDDSEQAYEEMIEQIPRLVHLDPPITRSTVQITRYAPLQADPKRFGIPAARYEPAYELIFSKDFETSTTLDLNAYCYYFERSYEPSVRLGALYTELVGLLDAWKAMQQQRRVELRVAGSGDLLYVIDSRTEPDRRFTLHGLAARVYSACADAPRTCQAIAAALAVDLAEVRGAMEELDRLQMVFRDRACFVGLGVPGEAPPPRKATERLWAVA